MSNVNRLIVSIERLLLQGKVDEAIQNCQNILRLLPYHPVANTQLGTIYLITGKYDDAIKYFEKSVESNPKIINHWANLIAAVDKSGNRSQVDLLLEKAKSNLGEQQYSQLSNALMSLPHIQARNMWDLFERGDYLNAEIAARLFCKIFSNHTDGRDLLERLAHLQQPKSA